MTAQTWDSALERARSVEDRNSGIAANIAVLTQLRGRWQDSVDMLTWMFDLVMVPSGAGWPHAGSNAADRLFVTMVHQQQADESVVKVQLCRSRGRASLAEPGGNTLIAGDICKLSTAPAVVEAFLYQIAHPAT